MTNESVDFNERKLDINDPRHRYALMKRYFVTHNWRINPRNLKFVREILRSYDSTNPAIEERTPGTDINPYISRDERNLAYELLSKTQMRGTQ